MLGETCPFMSNFVLLPINEKTSTDGSITKTNEVRLIQAKCVEGNCRAWGVIARGVLNVPPPQSTLKLIHGCKLIPEDK